MTSSNFQTKKKQSFFVNMGDVLAKETEQAKSAVEEESWDNREDADGASSVEDSIIRDLQERLSLTVGASDDNYESDDSGTQCDCDACQEPILSIRNPHYSRVQEHWAKLRMFIQIVYKQAGEGKSLDPVYEKQIQTIIHELVTLEPHLLYKQLEAQIQEWVIETELRQLETLLDTDNVDNIPHRFISGLLESYKNLMTGADLAFPILEELQATHLSKFNMTWQLLNEHIYQSCVYADPLVQNNVPIFIGKLSSTSESMESNKDLVKEFLYLDDNINSVSELWAECKRCLEAYGQEQEHLSQERRELLEMEWKCFKAEEGAGVEAKAKAALLNKTLKSIVTSEQQSIQGKIGSCKRSKCAEDSSPNQSSNKCAMPACDCMTLPQDEISNSLPPHPDNADSPMPLQGQPSAIPTAVNHKTCPDGSCSAGGHERVRSPPSIRPRSVPSRATPSSTYSMPASHSHPTSPHSGNGVKGTNASSSKQSKAKTPEFTPSSFSVVKKSCRNKPPQAPQPHHQHQQQQHQNQPHQHQHQASTCGTAAPPAPRANNCHKNRAGCSHHGHGPHNHRLETIKRIASCDTHRTSPNATNYHTHNGVTSGPLPDDEDSDTCGGPGGGSCSSCTPPDDSASDQSSVSNQKSSSSENRHCDCCYCEVFGHGVQSGAPVSRNYQEIRERLRLLLNKKKNSSKKSALSSSSAAVPVDSSACSQHRSSTASAEQQPLNGKLPAGQHRQLTTGHSAQNAQPQPPVFKGDENISDILNFIEGKTSKDSKKAAKKARQKEKKLQEMYQRKLEEEAAERAKLEAEKRRKLELLQEKERLIREQQRLERELQKQNQILNNNLKALSVKNNNNESNISNNSKKGKKGKQQQQNKKQQQPASQPADAASQKKNKKKNKKGEESSPLAQDTPSNGTDEGEVPKIVTIKRVMETSGHEPTVTITLRGATPSEDKVLYTLQNGHVCPIEEKNRQAAAAAAAAARSKKSGSKQQQQNKKPVATSLAQTKRPVPTHVQHTPGVVEINVNGVGAGGKAPVVTLGSGKPGVKSSAPASGVTLKKGSGPLRAVQLSQGDELSSSRLTPGEQIQLPSSRLTSATVGASQSSPGFSSMSVVNVKASTSKSSTPTPSPQLTSSTAIQISQAISSLTSSGGGEFNIEDLQLPPGITITKVVQPPLVNGNHEENSAASSLSCDGGDSDNLNKENTNLSANAEAPLSKKSRKKRNKQKQQQLLQQQQQNGELITSHSNLVAGGPPTSQSEDASSPIIKVKGSMVTIRNPAVFPPSEPSGASVGSGAQKKTGGRNKDAARSDDWNLVDEESVFAPKDIDLDNGDIDDAERELEAFKRFCSQSVPPKQKEKVHLNIKDIVLKKKRAAISCS